MKLIVGLGNPGEQYQSSRHNLGFMILDRLAGHLGISMQKQGFDSAFGKGKLGSEAVILAKPQTYMNLSGIAVAKLMGYFKIEVEDLIVVHDDLDLPFPTLRLKKGGGDGGHKGLSSIIQHSGSSDFLRVRIGIGKPARKSMVEKYVLSSFTEEESRVLPHTLALACEAVRETVLTGIQSAMRTYNGRTGGEPGNPIVT